MDSEGRAPMMFEERRAYAIAETKAKAELALLDPALVASEKAVHFDGDKGLFTVPFFSADFTVSFPSGSVATDGGSVSGAAAVLVLHYLIYQGEPLRSEGWLAYRDMPGARHFASAFEAMAEDHLASYFNGRSADFEAACCKLGGAPGEIEGRSFVLRALPRVPLMVVLWPADDAGGASSRILFPPGAPYYYHSEDLAALGVVAAERIIGADAYRGSA